LRTQFLKEYNALKKKLPSGSAVDSNEVKWRFFGDLFFLSASVQECWLKTMQFASKHSAFVLTIAFDVVVIAVTYLRYQSDIFTWL